MELGGSSFRFVVANLFAMIHRCWGGVEGWTPEEYKARTGISQSTLNDWRKQYNSGNKELQFKTINAVSLATGIRFGHLTSKVVNQRTYPFDYDMSKREFRTYVEDAFGLVSQFGLDQLRNRKK